MPARRESLGPLLDGHLPQVLSLPQGQEGEAGDLDEKCGENRGNEGETFGIFPRGFGSLNAASARSAVSILPLPLFLLFFTATNL